VWVAAVGLARLVRYERLTTRAVHPAFALVGMALAGSHWPGQAASSPGSAWGHVGVRHGVVKSDVDVILVASASLCTGRGTGCAPDRYITGR